MPSDMFGDVVEPSIKVGSKSLEHSPALDPRAPGTHRGRRSSFRSWRLMCCDAALEMAFVAAPPAAAPTAATPAASGGAGAEAGHGRQSSGCAGLAPSELRRKPYWNRGASVVGGVEGGVAGGGDRGGGPP